MLVERGAYEANPMMAPLVGGSAVAFTLVKIGHGGRGRAADTAGAHAASAASPWGAADTVLGDLRALIAYDSGF